MPHIQVTPVRGRTTAQKPRIAERLTAVLAEEAEVDARYISVSLIEVEPDGFAEAGELVVDRREKVANRAARQST
jgi:4-oxalocrotonate tautomerase family enzyme